MDSTDNKPYSFPYDGKTYTDYGSSVSTDEGYFMEEAGAGGPLATQLTPQKPSSQMNPCETRLAGIFTDARGARFIDVTDGDGYDPIVQAARTFSSSYPEEHNHMYPPDGRIQDHINVFAPGEGTVLGEGDLSGQNWMSIHYKRLGGVNNVILQIWHVENYNGKGGTPQGGLILLGQMGANGNIRYGPPGSPEGWHIHIQAFSWWGKTDRRGRLIDNRGKPIRGAAALGSKNVRNNNRLKLSDLFCK